MCECIPEHSPPKTQKTMSVQVGEREREGGRGKQKSDKVLDREEEEEEGGGMKEDRKISLRCSCYHGNPADNTYSLCHSGMKESDESIPPNHSQLLPQKHRLAMSKPQRPSPFVSSPGPPPTPLSEISTQSKLKWKPDGFGLIKIKVWSSPS